MKPTPKINERLEQLKAQRNEAVELARFMLRMINGEVSNNFVQKDYLINKIMTLTAIVREEE